MQLEVCDSMDWLYPDSAVRPRARRRAALRAARGTRPGCQLLLAGVPEGAALRVEGGALACAEGGRLPAPQRFHLLSVPVEENTGPVGFTRDGERNEHVTRRAPFRVFDVLRPMHGGSPALAGANALLLQWPVPGRARPGLYAGSVTVRAGSEAAEVPVELRVHRARVPAQGTLKVTNWFSVELMAERHGLKPWSEAHWRMIRRYADLMVRSRQNMFWAPLGYVAGRREGEGAWRFDLSRWRRLVRTMLDAGGQWIEGGHVAGRAAWDSLRYDTVGPGHLPGTDPQGEAYLAALLGAVGRLLDREGWRGRCVQHVADEPHGADVPDYRILCGIVRKHLPGVPLLDAVQNTTMAGALDIWVPLNSQYEQKRAEWEAYRAVGDELWHYTCCFPGGKYLNRLLDQSLLRPRLLHWGNYVYDLKGYLHWGLNHYRHDQNPFEQSVVGHGGDNKLPAGDTHVVYPGADGPWSSMRLEAMREGIEDYELLCGVAARDRARADRIARRVFRGFTDYTEDVAAFRRAQASLLEAADA